MYLLVQAHEYKQHAGLLSQSFQLRKTVFFDRLGWDVSINGEVERDEYDDLNPAYLLWCNETRDQLYGAVRLMPTTGPTLLYDVFRETFPLARDLMSPTIWEGTRMCIDEMAIERDYSGLRPDRAFSLLLLALCEVALHHGIDTLISNYEPHMKRVYTRAGAEMEELGRATGFGKFPVCCGAFEVSSRVLARMRLKCGVTSPLFLPAGRFRQAPLALSA